MELILNHVVPEYIPTHERSDIWNREVIIPRGEHYHIVAPSGKGKTSLIHFIYGMRSDYEGTIMVNGENIKAMTPEKKSKIRKQILSVIFQDLRLFPGLSVMENIEIKRQLNPYHPPEKIHEMATRLGIEHKLNQQTKKCSFGEQQRIAIIRSLMQPFDYLLLDEPFSHLDEGNHNKAMNLIRSECEVRGASMIFADLGEIDYLRNEKIIHL